jgi:murein DD-endopeptidase MepM/ murein hydrolase activator NlpD
MTNAHRDLASPEPWTHSLERSRRRRELLPKGRRENNRRKHISAALATAVVAGPAAPVAAAQVSGDVSAAISAESPANRAIEIREGGLPLQIGSQGELVAHVQKELKVTADGIFGPQTDAAVRSYQASAGLEVDGIVGLATWGALFEQGSASGASLGGSNIPPEVKQRVELKLERAGQDLAADGHIDGDAGVGGTVPESAPPAAAPESTAPAPQTAPAPNGQACGSATISSPVRGTVTSNFGPRWGRNHDGIDIAAPTGTPVRAAACGTVSLAGQQSGYGNMVCITHTSQFSTCYAHLSRFGTSDGAQVRQGQVIGYVGCTGSCTGPHLHFETRVGGEATDPRAYLGGSSIPGQRASVAGTASVGGPDLPREVLEQAAHEASATTATAAVGGGAVAQVGGQAVTTPPPETVSAEAVVQETAASETVAADGTVTAETPAAPETVSAEPGLAEPETLAADGTVTAETPAAPEAVPAEPVAVETEVAVPAEPVVAEAEVAAPVEPASVEPVAVEVAAPVAEVAVEAPAPAPAPAPVEPAPVEAPSATAEVAAPATAEVTAPTAEVAAPATAEAEVEATAVATTD